MTISLTSPPSVAHQAELSQIESLGHWQTFVQNNFPWLEVSSGMKDRFSAEVQAHRFAQSSLATIRSASMQVTRTRYLAERSEAGFVKLMWQMRGRMEVEQDQRRSLILPGQACICDTARPYRVSLSEGSHFAVLTLPYSALPGWEQISQRLCGAPWSDTLTSHAALGALMGVLGAPALPDTASADHVLQAVQWMLSASLHRGTRLSGSCDRNAGRLIKARQHILEHIDDPDLGPDELAAALHMSRRALYLLFKQYRITPSKLIHDMRLERCKEALADPAQRQRSLTEIACDNGFGDSATFSRMFKAQYGKSPSDWRKSMLTGA